MSGENQDHPARDPDQHLLREIEVETSKRGNFAVVHFKHHDLVAPQLAQKLQEDLEALLEKTDARCLLLDFSGVAHVGSAVFGLILHLAEHAGDLHKSVRICGMEGSIERAFGMLDAQGRVEVFATRRDALLADVEQNKERPWWRFW